MRHITDTERRARLAVRHGLAPFCRHPDILTATRAMTALHATEAPSVHLALFARVEQITVDDVDHALYRDRSLVKQLAMRRTMFVLPRELLPGALGSASRRVADQIGRRLVKEIEQGGLAADGVGHLDAARRAVTDRLGGGAELSAQQLREELPELAGRLVVSPGKAYGGEFPVAPRILTLLGAEGLIVRATNAGHWRTNRARWALMPDWLGEPIEPLPAEVGYADLVRRWLWTFGPGTETDLVWWLGSTKAAVRQALAELRAVEVSLDGGGAGWVLPDDLDPVEHTTSWAALLPVLDPTVMGWKERGFYLGDHTGELFDSNGNAGTTAWWNGRIVGCWVQDADGAVGLRLLEDVGEEGRAALAVEAARLDAWLGGDRVSTVYPSSLMRAETHLPVPSSGA
ncbi:winged helix DNA-binding domain-containing protein [Nocardioides sp.]|uniref:winged helix DNA-binding domain-containing protein n=1 Tax=Nocardioides sp. TaxID=35761 RepID=UPI002736DE5F|nr:winged helix DNA-binding domain-containing protein [Nocardioides sp.]MDP3890562.1 winged helix DNA-binding domain-containing protein [Nocardioides sp.]